MALITATYVESLFYNFLAHFARRGKNTHFVYVGVFCFINDRINLDTNGTLTLERIQNETKKVHQRKQGTPYMVVSTS